MRICFLGDSYVNGTGDPAYQGWIGRLCASVTVDITAYNLGIRGATSSVIRKTWFAEAYARLYGQAQGALVFSSGTNDSAPEDVVPQVSADAQIENTKLIIEAASSHWQL